MGRSTFSVAVVDDEFMVRRVVLRVLKLAKIAAREYPSGTKFLTEIDQFKPTCVLVDLVMPDMNGLEVCSRLADVDSEIQIILISGNRTSEVNKLIDTKPWISFLQKPVHAAALVDAVTKAFRLIEIKRASSR